MIAAFASLIGGISISLALASGSGDTRAKDGARHSRPAPGSARSKAAVSKLRPANRAAARRFRKSLPHLSPWQSVVLAQHVFHAASYVPTHLGVAKRKIVRRVGPYGAVVRGTRGRVLKVSSIPQRVEGAGGGKQAPSLRLVKRDSELEPEAPLMETKIDEDPVVGLSVHGIAIAPDLPADAVADPEQTQTTDGVVMYPEVENDTDMLLRPTWNGAETSWLLRSENSPSELSLDVTMPAGTSLEADPVIAGGGAFMADGQRVGSVFPASAVDAAGVAVPVALSFSESKLTAHLPDDLGQYQLPILVDPVYAFPVYTAGDYYGASDPSSFQQYVSQGDSSFSFAKTQTWLGVSTTQGGYGRAGYYRVRAPGTARVVRADMDNVYFSNPNNEAAYFYADVSNPAQGAFDGIRSQSIWFWDGYTSVNPVEDWLRLPLRYQASFGPAALIVCPKYNGGNDNVPGGFCDSSGGSAAHQASGNEFRVGLATNGPVSSQLITFMGGASVSFADDALPTNVAMSGVPSGWVQSVPPLTVSAQQGGLGLVLFTVQTATGSPVQSKDLSCYVKYLDGSGHGPTSWQMPPCPTSTSETLPSGAALPDGSHTLNSYATSLTGRTAGGNSALIKIDHTAPSLPAALPSQGATDQVDAPKTYDASATDQHSGVSTLTASWSHAASGTSGTPVSQKQCTVVLDGCSVSGQITVPPNASSPYGDYAVTVRADDRSSPQNVNTRTFTVGYYAPPGAPTNPAATAGNASATVSWTAPTQTGGAAISKYQVIAYNASTGQASGQTADTANGSTLTATVPGLINGQAYYFKVKARNEKKGWGAESTPSNTVTPKGPPGPPLNVTATAGNSTATIAWSPPNSDGGSPLLSYTVRTYKSGVMISDTTTANAATLSMTVANLENGSQYYFTVRATNAAGTGPESGASNTVQPTGPPPAPTNPFATAGEGSATVTWNAPSSNGGSPITKYIVTAYYSATGAASGQTAETANGSTLTATVNGLTNGTSYYFKVKAVNGAGTGTESVPSNAVVPRTRPSAPQAVTALPGDKLARVDWLEPASDGGSAITGYKINVYLASNDSLYNTFNVSASAGTATATGLTNGTSYYFKVIATNAVGDGPPSAASNTVTPLGLTIGSDRGRLGLEHYYGYDSLPTGDDSTLHVNVDTGNAVWQHQLFSNPGVGLSTTATLTYNSLDQPAWTGIAPVLPGNPILGGPLDEVLGQGYRQLGVGFSLSVGTITRLNEPLGGVATKIGPLPTAPKVTFVDADGTAHAFNADPGAYGGYASPPGVHLTLQYRALGGADGRWILTRPDGVVFSFNELGYQTEVEDRHGNTLTFTYEDYTPLTGASGCAGGLPLSVLPSLACASRVVAVTDAKGREVRIAYHPGSVTNPLPVFGGGDPKAGKIATIIDHAGRRTQFDYDNNGMLAKIIEGDVLPTPNSAFDAPGDQTSRREWDLFYTGTTLQPHYLSEIHDPNHPAAATNSAPATKLTYQDYNNGVLADPHRVRTIRTRRDKQTDVIFNVDSRKATLTRPGKAQDGSLPVVDSYDVDSTGRPTAMTEGDATPGGSQPLERSVTTMSWTADNMLAQLVRGAGPKPSTKTWTYDRLGQPLTETQQGGFGMSSRVTQWFYRYFDIADPDAPCPTSSDAHVGTATSSAVSDLCTVKRPLTKTRFEVDAEGNVRSSRDVTADNASATSPAKTFLYTPEGLLASEASETSATTGSTTYSDFDDNGLPQLIIDPRGNKNEQSSGKHRYVYDAVGNVLFASDPRYEGSAAPGTGTPYTTQLTYDAFDRVLSSLTPRLAAVKTLREYDYDDNGNPTKARLSPPGGNVEEYRTDYDDDDNPTCQFTPPVQHAGVAGATTEITKLTYDDRDNLASETAPNASAGTITCDRNPVTPTGDHVPYTTQYRYDALDRVIASIRTASNANAEPLVTAMRYDVRGNLIDQVDPKGSRAGNATAANPLQGFNYPDNIRFHWDYNDADELTERYEAPSSLNLHTRWTYDDNGRVKTQVKPRGLAGQAPDAAAFTTAFEYDSKDNIVRKTEGSTGTRRQQRITDYQRDTDGRLRIETSPRGMAPESTDPHDFETKYSYYADGDLKTLTLPTMGLPHEQAIQPIAFERNPVGDPIRITDARGHQDPVDNTFFDSGELRTTSRPWLWTANPSASSDAPEVTLADPSEWPQTDKLAKPPSDGQGDAGAVDPMEPAGLLPAKGATTLDYDGSMRLSTVTDTAGNATTLTRDALGRTTTLSQPFKSGQPIVAGYAYDFNGNQRYEDAPDITGDSNPERTVRSYDEFDRLRSVDAPGAERTAPTRTGSVGSALRETTSYDYTYNGQVGLVTEPEGQSRQTKYEYDAADRLKSEERTPVSDAPSGETGPIKTQWSYDDDGNVKCMQLPRGGNTSGCDESGNSSTKSTYTEHDQLESTVQKRFLDGSPSTVTTRYEYDHDGNQTLIDAPGGGAPSTGGGGLELPGGGGGSIPASGRYRTKMSYDGRDLLYTRTEGDGAGSSVDQTTLFERDPNGNLRRTVQQKGLNGRALTSARWDTDQDGPPTSSENVYATVQVYDNDNQLIQRWLPYSSSDTDAARYKQTFHRDNRGRIQWMDASTPEDGVGYAMRSTYDYFDNGWIKKQTDSHRLTTDGQLMADGDYSEYDYDAQGHQTRWLRNGGAGTPSGRTTKREYWPNGLLARRTADTGDTALRSYGYGYNSARSMRDMTDHQLLGADGDPRETVITYDELQRPTKIDETWGSGKDTTYAYDRDSNIVSLFTETNASASSDSGKTTAFAYDTMDRERTMKVTLGSGGGRGGAGTPDRSITTDVYDSGQVARRKKSNDVTEDYFYDPLGRLAQRKHNKSTRNPLVNYAYDQNGNRASVSSVYSGTPHTETFAYNARDQLVEWNRRPDARPVSGILGNLTKESYAYNASGAMTKKTQVISGQNSVVDFDMGDDDRLDKTTVTQGGTTSAPAFYRYDGRGNMTCSGGSTNTDACPGGTSYTYDSFDRQTSAVKHGTGEQLVSFVYDGLDRRDQRCQDDTDTNGLTCASPATKRDYGYYGLTDKLSTEFRAGDLKTYDRDSDLVARGQDTVPDPPNPSNHTFRPFVLDDQGTVVELENNANNTGNIVADYDYDPYGTVTFGDKQNEGGNDVAKDNSIRFQGFYFETEGRQYDMQARNYQPEIGRYLTGDRYESAAGDMALLADPYTEHRYAFLGGNPASRTEDDGHHYGDLNPTAPKKTQKYQNKEYVKKTNEAWKPYYDSPAYKSGKGITKPPPAVHAADAPGRGGLHIAKTVTGFASSVAGGARDLVGCPSFPGLDQSSGLLGANCGHAKQIRTDFDEAQAGASESVAVVLQAEPHLALLAPVFAEYADVLRAGTGVSRAGAGVARATAAKAGTSRLGSFGDRLRAFHADETGSIRLGRAPEFEGGRLTEDQALSASSRYLGEGYREVGPGRFMSADGSRVVRYGSHEVRTSTHHIHFEALENGRVVENTRAVIVP